MGNHTELIGEVRFVLSERRFDDDAGVLERLPIHEAGSVDEDVLVPSLTNGEDPFVVEIEQSALSP